MSQPSNTLSPRALSSPWSSAVFAVFCVLSFAACDAGGKKGAPDKQDGPPTPGECGACAANETCVAGQCVCTPKCDDKACEADSCGGTCPCPDGYVTDRNGNAVPPEECHDTCASAAFSCGRVCGETCGTCEADKTCEHGTCECKPVCDGTSCSDGCGGICDCAAGTVCNASGACVSAGVCTDTCGGAGRVCGDMCGKSCGACVDKESCVLGMCRAALNCKDCSLKLSMLSKHVVDGRIREVVLALDYEPQAGEPAPRLADIRLDANRPTRLLEVDEGEALLEAGKKLFYDETTKRNFQTRPDGSNQLFAYGVSDVENLRPGRLATLRYEVDQLGPVSFWMVRRAEMFAPPAADQALQSTPYDQAVMVSR